MKDESSLKIFVVEDDDELRASLLEMLESEDYQVQGMGVTEGLLEALQNWKPELLLLDVVLPGKGGMDILQELRTNPAFRALPIIMVTGGLEDDLTIQAFQLGVDDFVTKPFNRKILLGRIAAVARRSGHQQEATGQKFEKDGLILDLGAYRASADGAELSLTLTEFKILKELFAESGRILTRQKLLERALGSVNVTERTIDVHMCSLRKKLQAHGRNIETVRGMGYRLSA